MIAYLDCISGISGDMFLSSLIDLGFPISVLKDTIACLDIYPPKIEILKEERHGIKGVCLLVESRDGKHRTFGSIKELIQKSGLSSDIKEESIKVFETIAKAEAKIHKCALEEVHFHEIGAIDSIVDIIGVISGIKYLGIKKLISSPLPLGSGTADISHGVIPIPSPATLEILEDVPVYGTGILAELVTPTGAALVKRLAKGFGIFPPMIIKKIGYGIGSRNLKERPNIVRLIIGQPSQQKELDTVVILESHVDDCSPEHLGYLMDILFKKGALDVSYTPVFMKKNRPGVSIRVICNPSDMDNFMDIIFKETGTLGIRYSFNFRKRLKRESAYMDTPWGKLKIKRIYQKDGSIYIKPEYDDCLKIAKKYGISLKKIYEYVIGENK